MRRPIIILLALCVFMLTGCSPEVTPTPKDSKLTLEPTPSIITFPAEGGSQTYIVHSSGSNWTATANWDGGGWCRVTPNAGKDGETVTIAATANVYHKEMTAAITVKTDTGYILGIVAKQPR